MKYICYFIEILEENHYLHINICLICMIRIKLE